MTIDQARRIIASKDLSNGANWPRAIKWANSLGDARLHRVTTRPEVVIELRDGFDIRRASDDELIALAEAL